MIWILKLVDTVCLQTGKPARKCATKKNVEMPDDSMEISEAEEDAKTRLAEELSRIRMVEAQESTSPAKHGKQRRICRGIREGSSADSMLSSTVIDGLQSPQNKGLFRFSHMNIAQS